VRGVELEVKVEEAIPFGAQDPRMLRVRSVDGIGKLREVRRLLSRVHVVSLQTVPCKCD
jgi:hypothetical protein